MAPRRKRGRVKAEQLWCCQTNLKTLVLKVGAWEDVGFTSLINGCPRLERFLMQLIWINPIKRRREAADNIPHQCLKCVVVLGYFGRNWSCTASRMPLI
ncbi:hypothetical protein ACS0TY_000985 [Phlomoides rotata]